MRANVIFPTVMAALLWPTFGRSELWLTAELVPSVGVTGIETYRITATSDLGNVVGLDFTRAGSYGITGLLGQSYSAAGPTIFQNQTTSFGFADLSQDSHFLVNSDDVLSIFTEESDNSLNGAFAFVGDKQLSVGQSLPFAQLATFDASNVNLKGSFVVRRGNGDLVETQIELALSDIPIGPAPVVDLLPLPPPLPDPIEPARPIILPTPTVNPPEQLLPRPPVENDPNASETNPEPPPAGTPDSDRITGFAEAIRRAGGAIDIQLREYEFLSSNDYLEVPRWLWPIIDVAMPLEGTAIDATAFKLDQPGGLPIDDGFNLLLTGVSADSDQLYSDRVLTGAASAGMAYSLLDFADTFALIGGSAEIVSVPEPTTLWLCLAAMTLAGCRLLPRTNNSGR